jgi:hypothetical protein
MTKIAGSGSISQRHGSADPDPDPDPPQNVMDPEHCVWLIFLQLRLRVWNRIEMKSWIRIRMKVMHIRNPFFTTIRLPENLVADVAGEHEPALLT